MSEQLVGELEKRDIDKHVGRILRDLGNPEPPLRLDEVRRLLKIDLAYYSASDPGIATELAHRARLFAQKTIPDVGRKLATALAKSKLCAFWIPDSARILMDSDVPEKKHRWIEAHEISHSVVPWHREFLLGDNAHTLDPACHALIEAEANYGAGRLLFLQGRFRDQAKDCPLSFASIKSLSATFGNSILSTLWRLVEERDPSHPVFGVVSVHPHHPLVGKHDGPDPWRYYIRSAGFRTQFATVAPGAVYSLIEKHARSVKRGPVLLAQDLLDDANGESWEFQIESFSTGYNVLTIGFPIRPRALLVGA